MGYSAPFTMTQYQPRPGKLPTLLLSERTTEDNQLLWRAAIRRGWNVERSRGIRVPDGLLGKQVVLYVQALFAPSIARELSLSLVGPADDWLVKLPLPHRRRRVRLASLGEARLKRERQFVKPANDKRFAAQVYSSGGDLPDGYEDSMPVLIAEPVEWEVEYRCFVLDRAIRTQSPYLRHGKLASLDAFSAPDEEFRAATDFARSLLSDGTVDFPRAFALDVGSIVGRGWAVVEANPAWGSGIYGCDPDEVLEVLQYATVRSGSEFPG